MIKIVSDSSTLYSAMEARANNIEVATLSVTINNSTYKEYEEINTEEFIDIINEGHIPTSSQPAIGEVLEIYNKYSDYEIINIAMADGLSGTYNSAYMAKEMAENKDKISVINSKTLCGPHRYLVDLAVKLVESGKQKEEIINIIEELIKTSESFLIPNDFDYLVRGGRISTLAGKIGILIKLVPVVKISEDGKRLIKFTTKRTFSKAVAKICEALLEAGVDNTYNIYVSHACNEELAILAKNIILENIKDSKIEIKKLGPVFTTQGGPRCISIQTIKKHNMLG
ncbi:EDD domain protein, DegV family [Clostridium cavendishii DSM 21758]|uniref:EDD domain protein, DegV family n=1 Tax=Clostridium cavendishii DSM 21758 TaxID=1121302 RepID=A0A1M6DFG9_9CLOT|nr:DegV family protein [Clostridium cavendishii]SHI71861.1 EDD domain protein, DegV family [Clostridium cavendishii DSM 21758]